MKQTNKTINDAIRGRAGRNKIEPVIERDKEKLLFEAIEMGADPDRVRENLAKWEDDQRPGAKSNAGAGTGTSIMGKPTINEAIREYVRRNSGRVI